MPFQKKIECVDPLPALLKWAEQFAYTAFYLTSSTRFFGGVGAKRYVEIRDTGGAFERLEKFQNQSQRRILGYLGYDLKNDLENLHSANPDVLNSPEAVFFEPLLELDYQSGVLMIDADDEYILDEAMAAISNPLDFSDVASTNLLLESRTSRSEYMSNVDSIQRHLQRGDIYEANYCIQFSGMATDFDPVVQFLKFYEITQAPFSVFARLDNFYVLCASPERYLQNSNRKLISQPIKGTIKRAGNLEDDAALKIQLRNDPKEQNENVMIVDLVRNDLSRVAARNSVQVEKLFAVESFKTVHHLVSTISAELDTSRFSIWDAIRATFPMGSMTGAPKISAMKLIERYENFKRSAYSGAFGWIHPSGDFDFNVLIRSVFYDSNTSQVAFGVGSAITILADAEREYDECLLKAEALLQTFNLSPANAPV